MGFLYDCLMPCMQCASVHAAWSDAQAIHCDATHAAVFGPHLGGDLLRLLDEGLHARQQLAAPAAYTPLLLRVQLHCLLVNRPEYTKQLLYSHPQQTILLTPFGSAGALPEQSPMRP